MFTWVYRTIDADAGRVGSDAEVRPCVVRWYQMAAHQDGANSEEDALKIADEIDEGWNFCEYREWNDYEAEEKA